MAGKLDLLLIRVMSVFETSLSCLLYMLCLFPERAYLVHRILLMLQKCNPAKSQYSFTEKRCVVKAVSLFPVHFSGGDRGLFYNLYKYNILILHILSFKGDTIIIPINKCCEYILHILYQRECTNMGMC